MAGHRKGTYRRASFHPPLIAQAQSQSVSTSTSGYGGRCTISPIARPGAVHEEIVLRPLEGYAARRNVWMVTLDVARSAPALVTVVDELRRSAAARHLAPSAPEPARSHDLESPPGVGGGRARCEAIPQRGGSSHAVAVANSGKGSGGTEAILGAFEPRSFASVCDRWVPSRLHPQSRLSRLTLGDLAVVDGHGQGVGDGENAGTPGETDPDVGADGLLGEQVADRVDDGRDGLVVGE
jgi:hypothetical protein